MHEVGITIEIVRQIQERMAERGNLRVVRVALEIGKNTAVLPDAIRFCFAICCQGTALEGASLDISEPPGSELRIKEVEIQPLPEGDDAHAAPIDRSLQNPFEESHRCPPDRAGSPAR